MRSLPAFGLFLLAACSGGIEPSDPVMRLDIQLGGAAVDYADSVRVSLTLTNVSALPIQVYPADAYGFCMHAFEVFDSHNRPVSVTEALCALVDMAVPAPVALPSGGQLVITDWWQPRESTIDGKAILPGVYQVRGRAFGDERVARSALQAVLVR